MKYLTILESNSDKYKISKALRLVRESTPLLQKDVANVMGVSTYTISKLETNPDRLINRYNIDAYLKVFDMELEVISKGAEKSVAKSSRYTKMGVTGKTIDFEKLKKYL
jgi:transcriptional regulator with XRE-family HTH domain